MFFDINVYHSFVQNAAKVALKNVTGIEFSHRYEFVWALFLGRHRSSPEGTMMATDKKMTKDKSQLLGQCCHLSCSRGCCQGWCNSLGHSLPLTFYFV